MLLAEHWCLNRLPSSFHSLRTAGQCAGTADRGSGLRRVLLQGLGEQRTGCVSRDHACLGQQGAQELEAQQLQTGTEAGITDAWQDGLTE